MSTPPPSQPPIPAELVPTGQRPPDALAKGRSRHLRLMKWLLAAGLLLIAAVLGLGYLGGALAEAISATETLGTTLFLAIGGATGASSLRDSFGRLRQPGLGSYSHPGLGGYPQPGAASPYSAIPGGAQ